MRFQSPSLRGSGRFPGVPLGAPALEEAFQSPSLRGSGRFARRTRRRARRKAFQSPSLRGSGRFLLAVVENPPPPLCFNPLHCGAVVASSSASTRAAASRCFNPLHCGAVVASAQRCVSARCASTRVSIPFIAGQWSLRGTRHRVCRVSRRVSIPFIAGQWSLLAARRGGARRKESFNPLHCGAVVASSVCNSALPAAGGRFNPLHCGAVVASDQQHRRTGVAAAVSIPFIAGQWSLPRKTGEGLINYLEFQSPSLRGSGRFMTGR